MWNMYYKHFQEICWPVRETWRFGVYQGLVWIIWESCHTSEYTIIHIFWNHTWKILTIHMVGCFIDLYWQWVVRSGCLKNWPLVAMIDSFLPRWLPQVLMIRSQSSLHKIKHSYLVLRSLKSYISQGWRCLTHVWDPFPPKAWQW